MSFDASFGHLGDDVDVEFAPGIPAVESPDRGWLLDAADLLAEPDPGPTAWLVDRLIVDEAIIACVGRWKTTKSYGLLDVCISVATGRPAFGALTVPGPGPVLFVNEESGKAALWRRLDALCRGRAIDPEELRARLYVAANARVKLDDLGWQNELLAIGTELRPRLTCFDPLARMKGAVSNESAQNEMSFVVEFIRELRDATRSAVAFVHHTGHNGEHMRGSSDLETVWETRLSWKRDKPDDALVTVKSEHREAEGGDAIQYRILWDHDTRSMRFDLEADPLVVAVAVYLREHPEASANEVDENVPGTRTKILAAVKQVREQGGSDPSEPPPNHPPAAPPRGGSPAPPLRGAGTTTEAPGSNGAEPPLYEDVERWRALLEAGEPEQAEEPA